MKTVSIVAAAIMLVGCASTAPEQPPPERLAAAGEPAGAREGDSAADGEDATEPRKICTTQAMTGTRLPNRRICKTEEEWATIQTESEDTVEHIQRLPHPNKAN